MHDESKDINDICSHELEEGLNMVGNAFYSVNGSELGYRSITHFHQNNKLERKEIGEKACVQKCPSIQILEKIRDAFYCCLFVNYN